MSRSPARNATAAARDATVSVGFSQAISAASAPNLRVFGNQRRGRRAGTLSGGGMAQLGFALAQPFAPGEIVSVSLPPTLTSTFGGALTRQVYQFTAAAGGTGRGFFPDTAVVGNTGTRDQALGDVDHDGDLDLLAANGSSSDVSVCLNDGRGVFASPLSVPVSSNPGTLALGDLDGNGDLDLAALQSATGGAQLNLRFNDSQGLAAAPARLPAPGVALYPNPAHGQATLSIPAGLRPALAAAARPLRLYNSLGQLVLEQALRLDGRGEMQVGVAHLPAGLYSLQLVAGPGLITRPLLLN